MTAPIIFLDFDGVITSVRTRFNYLDPVAVHMLEQLCEKANASIVVSSTWRLGSNVHDIAVMFRQAGYRKVPFHNSWKTKDIDNAIRGEEIRLFLKENNHDGKYLILDDDSDFLEEQKPFHVKTDAYNGFLWDHFVKAHEILGVKLV